MELFEEVLARIYDRRDDQGTGEGAWRHRMIVAQSISSAILPQEEGGPRGATAGTSAKTASYDFDKAMILSCV